MFKYLPLLLLLPFIAACDDDDVGPEPSAVIIESLQVDRFPVERSDSTSWDEPQLGNLPDIIFTVEDRTNNVEVYSHPVNFRFDEVAAGTTLEWTNLNLRLANPGSVDYAFSIFDYDEDLELSELMGGVIARLYRSAAGTPEMAILDAEGEVAFSMTLSWEF